MEAAARRYSLLRDRLDESQRRAVLAAEAGELGRGGVSALSAATGVARDTIARGAADLAGAPPARVRAPGGGRKGAEERDPGLGPALRRLVEPATAGDPMRPLLWTTKSVRELSRALASSGRRASPTTVRKLLRSWGYSLQANAKSIERGSAHPDRDAQFDRINDLAASHLGEGCPVVSVDTKKKELVGLYKNAGRTWAPKGSPVEVNGHDFPGPDGKAIPYGVYDVLANDGWVSVGVDHDTAAFAVNTIRSWWRDVGRPRYPGAGRLLVCCDSGGSNSARCRAWKAELARLAAAEGLAVTVAHLPPGTSKWNKIEHKMFSFITKNWRAVPLVSHQVVVDLISAVTTGGGLTVHAVLDQAEYPLGVAVPDEEMAALPISRPAFHPEWVYTLHPTAEAAGRAQAAQDAADQAERDAAEAAEAEGAAGQDDPEPAPAAA